MGIERVSCHGEGVANSCGNFLKLQRVTIRGPQPSARLSKKICLSEGSGGGSLRGLRGVSPRVLRALCGVSAGFCGGYVGFSEGFGG